MLNNCEGQVKINQPNSKIMLKTASLKKCKDSGFITLKRDINLNPKNEHAFCLNMDIVNMDEFINNLSEDYNPITSWLNYDKKQYSIWCTSNDSIELGCEF